MSKHSPEEDERWLDPYEQGRRRYQRKDYEGALDAFNQVCLVLTPRSPPDSLPSPQMQRKSAPKLLSREGLST